MKRTAPCSILFLAAVWLCYTVSIAFARTDFDDIKIAPELIPSGSSFHGYAEYRIAVSNLSPDATHQVTLTLPKSNYGISGNRIRWITRSVVVGPSATVHVTLLQPSVNLDGRGLGVSIDGDVQDEAVPLAIADHGQHERISTSTSGLGMGRVTISSSSKVRILISRNVDTTDLHVHAGKLLSSSPSGSGISPSGGSSHPYAPSSRSPSYETIDLGLPVSAWSRNWLGYSRYDGVIVTGDDVRKMPPDVQSAVWRYVECGGALLVLGGRELPDSWGLKVGADTAGLANYDVDFGQCLVSAEMDTKRLTPDQWSEIVFSWVKTASSVRIGRSVEAANTMFPVVEGLGVPVRGMFLLMLLFAVAIGPVNLIALSRKKRRIWMLWTTPVISLITCLAVFGYATFAEGWTRHARIEGLTILNEKTHRATTIGWTAFYSSLTPGDGLHFDYETELTPQIASTPLTGTPRTVDWTHDQHLASGWATARVPAHFMLRKSEVRRERVTFRRGLNNRLSVVNGLGADIRHFWLADKDGAVYSGVDIPAGAEAELSSRTDLRLGSPAEADETFKFELWDPSINTVLDTGNISPMLRDEMKLRGALLSDDVSVSVQKHGLEWEITDEIWDRMYTIKADKTNGALRIHSQVAPNLRGIFASEDWIQNIEHLKKAPENYLRPGCYIATLSSAPFIEEGLRKTTEKRYSSVVYGILNEE